MTLWGRIQGILGRFGYQLQKIPLEGSLDRDLQRVIADRGIDTVLDMGAHVGSYASRLRQHGYAGRIVSFEPSERPFRALASKTAGNRSARQIALGDTSGVAELFVYAEHEEFTSLRKPSDYGREHFGLTVQDVKRVPVRRLDDVAAELELNPTTTLVKIDTQGHDPAVIAGSPNFLTRAAALQVEVPMFGLYEGAPSGPAFVQSILDTGFDLVGLYPVHEHPRPLIPVEFDGLFARGAAAG
ncbi:FkbM family methyltransferase [Geodermatophilus sp. SYSU D01036]